MPDRDTIRLLRECDAGIQMGLTSISDVLDEVNSESFQQILKDSRAEHETLKGEIQTALSSHQDLGKAPNPVAKSMSWMKTNMKLALDDSDATIADLMTDGCHMGIKSLSRYRNQYRAADGQSKGFADRLIAIEEKLATDLRAYL